MFIKWIFHKKKMPQMGVNIYKVTSISENENFEILIELGIIWTELNFWIQITIQNRKILNLSKVKKKICLVLWWNLFKE